MLKGDIVEEWRMGGGVMEVAVVAILAALLRLQPFDGQNHYLLPIEHSNAANEVQSWLHPLGVDSRKI